MSELLVRADYIEAAAYIRAASDHQPELGLVLGSGLSGLADALEGADVIPFHQIPKWPVSTVHGHSGRLVIGELEGKSILVMQGRVHFYEGYSMQQITMPVRVMQQLGIATLILTNAAGGLNPEFSAGDLMLIRDHINMPGLAGNNPLRGPNEDELGPRFPDMTTAYDPALRELARAVASKQGATLREGTYVYVGGPSFETPAELRYLRQIGGDAVGMSTAPAAIVASHGGTRVLGLSTITNLAKLEADPGTATTHEEVLEVGAMVVPRLTRLIHGIVRAI
jgi:purine-nucleoside phosphorylase